jgi:aspartate/methionine/tyrosine aminotransferase
MSYALTARIAATDRPPVPMVYGWLDGLELPDDRPLLNVSQAAPVDPPPEELRDAMARAVRDDPQAHLYGPVLGMDALRGAVAKRWSGPERDDVTARQVAITSGCNQAFVAAMATIAAAGDEVIIPTPWYFNHKMWLDMSGVNAVPLPVGPVMLPEIDRARDLINGRTKAIVLVSPNNPAGVEYPAALIRAFYDLAQSHGLALVLDETYRDFRRADVPPHDLFQDEDWDATLVQLYSFSKAYRLTGHRVGALTASANRLVEVEKFLDTVTICPAQLGQIAALWGIQNLDDWLQAQRHEILARADAMRGGFGPLSNQGWQLKGTGGYFAYVKHPFPDTSVDVARALLKHSGILSLPGTLFRPTEDQDGERELRIAFANIDRSQIDELFARLADPRI